MKYEQIMLNWGVSFPDDSFIPEYLTNSYPNKCFFVDSLPTTVHKEYLSKFDQVEVVQYNDLQEKIAKIMLKLWLYNDVYFKSELLFQNQAETKARSLSPRIYDELRKLKSYSIKTETLKIVDISQLNLILDLCDNDIIDALFIFQQYQIILVPSWSCYFAFINDLSRLNAIEKIINVEGLYLRRNGE